MDEHDRKALDDIEQFGCHVLCVAEGDGEPCFTYSIGINQKQNKPDVIVMGLKSDIAHWMVNRYKNRLLDGEVFESGKYYSGFLEGFDVCFVEVAKKHYEEYFGWGRWLHGGNDFKVLQLVWPTTKGVWPWEGDLPQSYEWAQPILNESGVLDEIQQA